MSYRTDRDWSDRFIPDIKKIVGPLLIEPAPFEVDANQATDLILLRARDMMIAARVRRPGFWDRYQYEFTIRSRRDSGAVTELSKIINGWGDWMFYGHADAAESLVEHWWVIDLHALRAHLILHRDEIRNGDKPNGDGTYFKWFDLTSFRRKPEILIGWSDPLPRIAA